MPPRTVTSILPVAFPKQSILIWVSVILTGAAGSVIVFDKVSEQPLRSITVTVYVPAIKESVSSSVSRLDHSNEYVGTPPITVKSIKPSAPPKQETALESALSSINGGSFKVTEALISQPFVSVTKTL